MTTLDDEHARLKSRITAALSSAPDEDAMAFIDEIMARLEVARGALVYVRHRDARWHDDDVVTPALATLDAPLRPDPVVNETTGKRYKTIKEAFDAAAKGDIIRVETGRLYEQEKIDEKPTT